MGLTTNSRTRWTHWWPGMVAWVLWALAIPGGLAAAVWLDHLLRRAGRPDLVQLDASGVPLVLVVVSAATVGALLASRRPAHPVGWLLLALGLSAAASGAIDGSVSYGLLARAGAMPAARYLVMFGPPVFLTALACTGFILLLTPTGSLPSPRWRWWARIATAAPVVFLLAVALEPQPLDPAYRFVANPLGIRSLRIPLAVADTLASAITIVAILVAAASLVVRLRRAPWMERQQLRWVAFAACLASVAAAVVFAGTLTESTAVISWAGGVCLAILPLAIGAAVVRYRLYDLDRTVNFCQVGTRARGGY